jgi:hypothetical protein
VLISRLVASIKLETFWIDMEYGGKQFLQVSAMAVRTFSVMSGHKSCFLCSDSQQVGTCLLKDGRVANVHRISSDPSCFLCFCILCYSVWVSKPVMLLRIPSTACRAPKAQMTTL